MSARWRYVALASSEYARTNGCRYCGSMREGPVDCKLVECKACGSPQCFGNGSARGTCSICLVGLLPGWSGHDRRCGYKGCFAPSIAEAPRVKQVCRTHVDQPSVRFSVKSPARSLAKYIEETAAERKTKLFELIDLGVR